MSGSYASHPISARWCFKSCRVEKFLTDRRVLPRPNEVGRAVPCAPGQVASKDGAHGVTRPGTTSERVHWPHADPLWGLDSPHIVSYGFASASGQYINRKPCERRVGGWLAHFLLGGLDGGLNYFFVFQLFQLGRNDHPAVRLMAVFIKIPLMVILCFEEFF